MPRGVVLTVRYQELYDPLTDTGFRVRVEARAGSGMPDALFVYRATPIQPGEPGVKGEFDHVATAWELDEVPPDQPLPNSLPPWYRSATVDVLCRDRDEAVAFVELVTRQVEGLRQSLDRAEQLLPAWDVVVGTPAEGWSSSSSMG